MTDSTIIANPDSPDVAVLLPGTGYTAQAPLLYWCGRLLAERGWQVRAVSWIVPDDVDPVSFVERATEQAFAGATARRLVVAKSFGSFALPWAVREKVPGIWLTPVMTAEAVTAAMQELDTTGLAIGGDADAMWLPAEAGDAAADLITIKGADHALTHVDGWRSSLDAQRRVYDAVSRHLDDIEAAATS